MSKAAVLANWLRRKALSVPYADAHKLVLSMKSPASTGNWPRGTSRASLSTTIVSAFCSPVGRPTSMVYWVRCNAIGSTSGRTGFIGACAQALHHSPFLPSICPGNVFY